MKHSPLMTRVFLSMAISGAGTAVIAAEAESTMMDSKTFVMNAAQDGMAEVEAGKTALMKSKDPAIRSFAQRMVDDHGKANAELATLASGKGIMAPKTLDAEHAKMLSMLKTKSGADFDQAYAEHMNEGHTKAVALFESEAKSDDADFAQFAQKTLPTLKEHKQLAAKLPMK
jgi:putative membrane protein